MKKRTKRILSILLAIVLLIGIGSGIYLADYYHADDSALAVMGYQGEDVKVIEDDGTISFIPKSPKAGLIFYQGGKVECQAYAPLMLKCAQNGIISILAKMPANLAVLKSDAADGLGGKYPEITNWFIGGHSLGGAMASIYVADHASEYEGLILLAAYSTEDISKTDLKVLSIYGSDDAVMNRETYEENQNNLPKNFEEKEIKGGCHAYFGSYGPQDGDGKPSISNEKQIEIAAQQIAQFILK